MAFYPVAPQRVIEAQLSRLNLNVGKDILADFVFSGVRRKGPGVLLRVSSDSVHVGFNGVRYVIPFAEISDPGSEARINQISLRSGETLFPYDGATPRFMASVMDKRLLKILKRNEGFQVDIDFVFEGRRHRETGTLLKVNPITVQVNLNGEKLLIPFGDDKGSYEPPQYAQITQISLRETGRILYRNEGATPEARTVQFGSDEMIAQLRH